MAAINTHGSVNQVAIGGDRGHYEDSSNNDGSVECSGGARGPIQQCDQW